MATSANAATLRVAQNLLKSDLSQTPVVLIGQPKHIAQITFEHVACKLQPNVTAEILKAAQEALSRSGADSVPLYLNQAVLAQLPSKCSRHNTPTQVHALTKAVLKHSSGNDEAIVVACEKRDVFASACAVARAFPLFNRKTSGGGNGAGDERQAAKAGGQTVSLEFLVMSAEGVAPAALTADEVMALEAAMNGVRLAARIVDAPCEDMNVCAFLREVERVGEDLNIKPTVIRGEELMRKGLGGIWSVGKAATSLPALAVLSHTPEGATETVAWVGKGIVYDTGGLSLKPRTAMVGMKRDCGGAAGILGAFATAVRCGFRENLHAVFCLAENAVGPLATRPDDIVTMYSGKTVEVNNTDAEGRMVLSDGVVFAQKDLGATVILDMATLTGAQGIATGKYHAAVLSNSSDWEDKSISAGKLSGDLTFPLPFAPELHFREFSSAVADMKNSVADRGNAQSSCAGLFIFNHLGFDFDGSWIHVDMASPAYCGERATGYGVALLTSLFADFSTNALVKELSPTVPTETDTKRIKTDI